MQSCLIINCTTVIHYKCIQEILIINTCSSSSDFHLKEMNTWVNMEKTALTKAKEGFVSKKGKTPTEDHNSLLYLAMLLQEFEG